MMEPQEWDVISVYSRAQAIQDGELIDVTEAARELGFRHPVATTRAVWCECVEDEDGAQSEHARLRYLLITLLTAIRTRTSPLDESVLFDVVCKREGKAPQTVSLLSVCGPGDDVEPVLTISFPDED